MHIGLFFIGTRVNVRRRAERSPPGETENKESFGQAFTKACGVRGEALQMEKSVDF